MQFPKIFNVITVLSSANAFYSPCLSQKKIGNTNSCVRLITPALSLKSPALAMTLLESIQPMTPELSLIELNVHANSIYVKYAGVLEKAGVSNSCLKQILLQWSASHRSYHGPYHLEKILENIEQYRKDNNLVKDHPIIIRLIIAAFFHDVIYETLAKPGKNEDDSIEFYKNNIDPEHHDKWVEDSIESTKHRKPPEDPLARTFWQFDNAIVYKNNAKGLHQWEKEIRQEYQAFSYDIYKPERLKFLESCLKNPKLFHSEQHLQNFENFIKEFESIRPTVGIYTCKHSFNSKDIIEVKKAESKFDLVYLLPKNYLQKLELKDQLQCKVTSDQIVKIQAVADVKYI